MYLTKKFKTDIRPLEFSGGMVKRIFKGIPYLTVLALCPTVLFSLYSPKKYIPSEWNLAPVVEKPTVVPISRYDGIIQRVARQHRLDWRLVASIIFAESSFRKNVTSHAGARGLMQLMPVVLQEQRTVNGYHPENNIRAGVRHLQKKLRLLKGKSPEDILQLSLAAYNAGLGHVRDAQRLAIRLGKDPHRWKDVEKMLSHLENPKYFENAQFGYVRGSETIQYVKRVMTRYYKYQDLIPSPRVVASSRKVKTSKPKA